VNSIRVRFTCIIILGGRFMIMQSVGWLGIGLR
jgi:hypothetical protein